MSLDAHIFRTPQLASLVLSLEFSNPNSFEGALAIHCSDPKNGCAGRMSSHEDAVVVNLPVNLVQTHWTSNRHMDDGPRFVSKWTNLIAFEIPTQTVAYCLDSLLHLCIVQFGVPYNSIYGRLQMLCASCGPPSPHPRSHPQTPEFRV